MSDPSPHQLTSLGAAVLTLLGLGVMLFAGGDGLIAGGFILLVGLPLLIRAGLTTLARGAFHQARLEPLGPVPLGGTATLQLLLVPRRTLRLTGHSKVVVTCLERAHYAAGTTRRSYQDTLYRQELPLELPQVLSQPLERRIAVPVPRDIPPTWSGASNWFLTEVQVRVDIDASPDLELDATLDVLPEVVS